MSRIYQAAGWSGRVLSADVTWATLAGVMAAGLLGVLLVLGVGLLGPEVIHNAAHDVRHGLSFPCH